MVRSSRRGPTPAPLATWQSAVAEDAQRFHRNRRITLAVVTAAAALAVTVVLLLAVGMG